MLNICLTKTKPTQTPVGIDADTTELENQIDQLVYQPYDLTEEEIEIVENSIK